MNFMEIANVRQSCRSYDPCRVGPRDGLEPPGLLFSASFILGTKPLT